MNSPRAVYALALADFRERTRRYSFLATLLFAVYLGYAAARGQISLRLGEYRGLYTSAWVGAMMSLIKTTFLSVVGFYIVKNALARDHQTEVGEILASTPLSRIAYLLGKFVSNFAVLAPMSVCARRRCRSHAVSGRGRPRLSSLGAVVAVLVAFASSYGADRGARPFIRDRSLAACWIWQRPLVLPLGFRDWLAGHDRDTAT
jgi:hypothetical protein